MGRRKLFFVIFLCSFSGLAYEITLTRIFSISLSYHFASMIISIAMLGIGASGTVLSLVPRLKDPSRIGFEGLLLGLSFSTSYLLSKTIPFDPVKLLWAKSQLFYVVLYYLFLSVPFFFSGLIIAKAFTSLSQRSSLFYGGDLLGAGAGSMGILYLMTLVGPHQTVLVISSVAFLSPLVLGGKRLKLVSLGFILLNLVLLIVHPSWMFPQMSSYKGLQVALRYPGSEHVKTYDSPFSRIDLFKSPAVRFAPGLSLKYLDPLPDQIGFSIDGGEINAVTSAADPASHAFLRYLPASLPYEIRKSPHPPLPFGEKRTIRSPVSERGKNNPGGEGEGESGQPGVGGDLKDVLILDPRGGLQVLLAKYFGLEDVLKVEGNPLLIRIIRNDLREFSGDLYTRNTWAGLGRSFLRSGDLRFDLIDLSLMEAIPSGSPGISEDYRFTVEAFKEYVGHLKSEGFLCISLFLMPPPRTELRLISTIAAAMEELGIGEVGMRVVAVRTWGTITILAKRSSFVSGEIEAVKQFAKDRRFDLVYYPGIREEETNRYVRMASDEYFHAFKEILDPETRKAFIDRYLFDIRPVRDENPFFHYYLKLENIREIYRTMGEKWQYFIEEGYLLPAVFIQVLFLSLILILLPAISSGKADKTEKLNLNLNLNLGLSFLYFGFLGLGFMLVEISLVQKMILPLENPSYAVGTVLASILISSGIGSLLAYRFPALRTPFIAIIISILVIAYSFILPLLAGIISTFPMSFKIPLVFLILLPLGLLMGIPFPLGVEILGRGHGYLIPWAWAINGCFSVLAPLLGVMLAIRWGFRTVLWIGAAAYLSAYLTSFSLLPRSSEQKPQLPSVPS
jgi:hypothetical protein